MTGGVNVPVTSTWNPSGVNKAKADVGAFEKQANAALGTFKKSFGAAAVGFGAALGLGAIKNQIAEALGAASDLNESMSKSKAVFGDSARGIEQWSTDASTALLMTQQQALEATGTFGNLFQAFGIGQEQAAAWSQRLVELGADLSSFNNLDPTVVMDKLRSGITGEQEAVKDLGIALTDQRLRQEALTQGIYKGTGVLTANQKVQAAYALILKDTALAQGDVARTATGAANTMRTLQAAAREAQATIGEELLDSIQQVSTSLGGPKGMAEGIDAAAQSTADAIAPIAEITGYVVTLNDAVKELTGGFDVLGSAYGWVESAIPPLSVIRGWKDWGSTIREDREASEQFVHTFQDVKTALLDTARAKGLIPSVATSIDKVDTSAKNAKTSVDRLNGALDTLYGRNQSREAARLALKQMRQDGPNKSGSRETTVPGDPKVITDALGRRHVVQGTEKKTVQFATEDDARRWALDYAKQAQEYAGTFKRPGRQAAVLENAQDYIAGRVAGSGVDNPRKYAASLIGAPGYLTNPRPWEGMYAKGFKPQQSPQTWYIDKVELQRGASWDQLVKEAQKRSASSGGRFSYPASVTR